MVILKNGQPIGRTQRFVLFLLIIDFIFAKLKPAVKRACVINLGAFPDRAARGIFK